MANKTELKKFVELKKEEALSKLREEREIQISNEKEVFFSEYKDEIESIKEQVLKASCNFDKVVNKIHESKKGMIENYCDTPVRAFNKLLSKFNINELSTYFHINSVRSVEDAYSKKINECKNEYNGLLAVIQSMNAKDGIELLKNLGFDTENIGEPKQVTTLITNIDAKKLFI